MAREINPAAVREIRRLVGISGREFGRRCGIDPGTVSNIERGKHGVSPELMRKIADQLGVSLDSITVPMPEPEAAAS